MKKYAALLSAVISAGMIFSGCGENPAENPDNEDNASESGMTQFLLDFPSGAEEINEYNKEIFEINGFSLSLSLPSGWSVTDEASDKFPLTGAWSARYIYDENGSCIGAAGYNVIPELSEAEKEIPAAVYNQIALGNGYQFAVRDRYDIVQSGDTYETALTDVYYSDNVNNGGGEKINKGILSLDRQAGVYVAIDLDALISDGLHREIAESMKITQDKPADITDAEITRLIEESHFIRLMTDYDTLSFEQTEPSKWQDRDYYKVTDERFDEWDEWVEYVRTVYGESMEEQFLTDARYININGFTFTDGLSKGCDILFDRYTYERIAPIGGRPACEVKCPDAFDETGEAFYTDTVIFEYTDDGWRIWDIIAEE